MEHKLDSLKGFKSACTCLLARLWCGSPEACLPKGWLVSGKELIPRKCSIWMWKKKWFWKVLHSGILLSVLSSRGPVESLLYARENKGTSHTWNRMRNKTCENYWRKKDMVSFSPSTELVKVKVKEFCPPRANTAWYQK